MARARLILQNTFPRGLQLPQVQDLIAIHTIQDPAYCACIPHRSFRLHAALGTNGPDSSSHRLTNKKIKRKRILPLRSSCVPCISVMTWEGKLTLAKVVDASAQSDVTVQVPTHTQHIHEASSCANQYSAWSFCYACMAHSRMRTPAFWTNSVAEHCCGSILYKIDHPNAKHSFRILTYLIDLISLISLIYLIYLIYVIYVIYVICLIYLIYTSVPQRFAFVCEGPRPCVCVCVRTLLFTCRKHTTGSTRGSTRDGAPVTRSGRNWDEVPANISGRSINNLRHAA